MPLLPLRDAVLGAGSVAQLQVGRASSLEALRAAQAADGQLAVFTQKDSMLTEPTETDLHPVGCSVIVEATVPFDGGQWLIVRALQWIRLEAIVTTAPCTMVRVAPFVVRQEAGDAVSDRERTLRDRLRLVVTALPDGDRILRLTERMTPLELADAAIANLPCSIDDKARYAAEPSLAARLDFVIGLLDRAA